eukprot:TRINITY_DN27211_c0_g1_i1.p1 TRINITY_DN27211_c0_g1~~TRINITY_DN27211_c0_g1_i1.p1  ORF type:complete len:252 (+),score=41.25 TRINITY_DN27211_c0_g1_i1:82-837(+)
MSTREREQALNAARRERLLGLDWCEEVWQDRSRAARKLASAPKREKPLAAVAPQRAVSSLGFDQGDVLGSPAQASLLRAKSTPAALDHLPSIQRNSPTPVRNTSSPGACGSFSRSKRSVSAVRGVPQNAGPPPPGVTETRAKLKAFSQLAKDPAAIAALSWTVSPAPSPTSKRPPMRKSPQRGPSPRLPVSGSPCSPARSARNPCRVCTPPPGVKETTALLEAFEQAYHAAAINPGLLQAIVDEVSDAKRE